MQMMNAEERYLKIKKGRNPIIRAPALSVKPRKKNYIFSIDPEPVILD